MEHDHQPAPLSTCLTPGRQGLALCSDCHGSTGPALPGKAGAGPLLPWHCCTGLALSALPAMAQVLVGRQGLALCCTGLALCSDCHGSTGPGGKAGARPLLPWHCCTGLALCSDCHGSTGPGGKAGARPLLPWHCCTGLALCSACHGSTGPGGKAGAGPLLCLRERQGLALCSALPAMALLYRSWGRRRRGRGEEREAGARSLLCSA